MKVGGKRVELVGSGSSAVESADVVDCSVATTNMHSNRGGGGTLYHGWNDVMKLDCG